MSLHSNGKRCPLCPPLHEQPLHIIPKPIPRNEPTIPRLPMRDFRYEWGTDVMSFLVHHMEPIEGNL